MATFLESYIGRHRLEEHGTLAELHKTDITRSDLRDAPVLPSSLDLHASNLHGTLTPPQTKTLERLEKTDWSTSYLNIRKKSHQEKTAESVALGAPLAINFGNIYGLFGRADLDTMIRINIGKGREPLQVASVVTTPEHIHEIFDFDQLKGVTEDEIMRMMERFYDRSSQNPVADYAGPIGFRGPASPIIHDHLTTKDAQSGLRTVQLIAPGFDCPSNAVFRRIIDMIGDPNRPYLMATSANESSNKYAKKNGKKVKIPSHHTRTGMQGDIKNDTYPMKIVVAGLPEDEERRLRESYKHHEPKSTTILDFTNAVRDSEGRVGITLARSGSLSNADTREVVASLGMTLHIPDEVATVSDVRLYPDDKNGNSIKKVGTIYTGKKYV